MFDLGIRPSWMHVNNGGYIADSPEPSLVTYAISAKLVRVQRSGIDTIKYHT